MYTMQPRISPPPYLTSSSYSPLHFLCMHLSFPKPPPTTNANTTIWSSSLFTTLSTMSSPYQETCLPPRKLLRRRSMEIQPPLSINIDDDDDEHDLDLDVVLNPYSTDDFRMYEFKIRRCTRSRSHDWTDCPFAHPGEKARRRDPRRYHYSGEACPDFRRGTCPRGDTCEFAHGVFECWLHPARYRTHACKDGKNCKRKVCFFAHTRRQLRLLPGVGTGGGCHSLQSPPPLNRYGGGCCCCGGSVASSPTSTLTPLSPNNLFSRFSEASYKTALLLELVSSLEGMGISALQDSPTKNETNNNNGDLKWGFGEKMMSGRSTRDVLSEDCLGGFNGPDLEWVNELVM